MRRPAAVLDWDDTLHRGITLLPWVELLAGNALFDPDRAVEVHGLYAQSKAGELGYEQFAHHVVEAYAAGLRDVPVADVVAIVYRFLAEDRARVFPFVVPMFELFRAHGVATFLVSGCPQEVLDGYRVRLGFDKAYGVRLYQDGGIYTGRVERNSALESIKERIVFTISKLHPILVAMGNTDSDWPLLKSAELPLVLQPTSAVTGWVGAYARPVAEDEVVARIQRFLSDDFKPPGEP